MWAGIVSNVRGVDRVSANSGIGIPFILQTFEEETSVNHECLSKV